MFNFTNIKYVLLAFVFLTSLSYTFADSFDSQNSREDYAPDDIDIDIDIDIVVAANVYGHGICSVYAGFGDVAHGARAARLLREKFPNLSIKFVVEGNYDESCETNNDYKIFNKIASIPGIETTLINNHEDSLGKDLVNKKVKQYLALAKIILHAPASTISIIENNPEGYSGKMIYFDEYNSPTFLSSNRKKYPEMQYFQTGFPSVEDSTGGMFLKEPFTQFEFESEWLRKYIKLPEQTCEFDRCDSQNQFYFCYHNKANSIISSIILFNMLENSHDQDITIVSSCSEAYLATMTEEDIAKVWRMTAMGSDNPVKKIHLISSMGLEREYINNDLPEVSKGRTVTVVMPNAFSPHDSVMLGKYAKLSVSSGDLSMSDIFAVGRFPVPASDGKTSNSYKFNEHLMIFSNEYPQYQKQVDCVAILTHAMANIADNIAALNKVHINSESHTNLIKLRSYSCKEKVFGTKKWSAFEQSYIGYLHSIPGICLEDTLCNAVSRKLGINITSSLTKE